MKMRRIIALLTVLVMCINTVGIIAFAVDTTGTPPKGTFEFVTPVEDLTVSDTDRAFYFTFDFDDTLTSWMTFNLKVTGGTNNASISANVSENEGSISLVTTSSKNNYKDVTWSASEVQGTYAVASSNTATMKMIDGFDLNIPANAYGEFTITLEVTEWGYYTNYGTDTTDTSKTIWVDKDGASKTYTTTVTVAGPAGGEEEPTDYTVEVVNSSNDLVAVDDTVTLNVNVNQAFNSSKIVLKYDTDYLEYKSGACAQAMGEGDVDAVIKGEDGMITITDYGTAFAAGTAYTLTFIAKKATTGTSVTFDYAGFSTAEQAITSDLIAATEKTAVSVPVGYTVTAPTTDPHIFSASAATVVPGGSVNITGGSPYYAYVLEATGGTLAVTDDGWTVSNVTGNVSVIVNTATPKSYDVTVKTVDKNGNPIDGIDDVVTTNGATHGTSFSYTLPDDTAPGLGSGVQYSLTSITVGGEEGVYTTAERTSTILGKDVTGAIVITIVKEDLDPNAFAVEMTGEASAGTLSSTQVASGGNAILTLNNKLAGYTYTVTATMGGNPVEPAVSGDVYTVSNVTGKVVFTISKELDKSGVKAVLYLECDTNGTQANDLYLVFIETAEISNKTYQYNGQNFFYSPKVDNVGYDAYCLLVEAEDAEEAKAAVKGDLKLVDTAATQIIYTGDVNKSNNVDVNDAQLVWSMYNISDIITCNADTMEKYLRADVNGDKELDSSDAVSVIGKLSATTNG